MTHFSVVQDLNYLYILIMSIIMLIKANKTFIIIYFSHDLPPH